MDGLDPRLESSVLELTDESVRQMLVLAERLREARGGELDDESIQAVAEATGAPVEYVRVAARLLPEQRRRGVLHSLRSAVLTLEPEVRCQVFAAVTATLSAGMHILAAGNSAAGAGFYDTLSLIAFGLGLWNVSLTRDSRSAVITGAMFAGVFFVANSLFAYALNAQGQSIPSALLVVFLGLGALGGFLLQKLVSRFRHSLGIQDPAKERQELLRQLVSLQDKLRSGEQSITFLSVDIVGSTQIKAQSDPLSVEFTFNEYHLFVDVAARRFQGRIHSTAGDGVTMAFDHPQQAFAAAKNLQTGIVELNTFRNKTGIPIVLRCGIHTGSVVAPTAGDIKSINFAHVIDVASHMQKVCPPGGIAVSDTAASEIPGGSVAIGAEKVRAAEISGTVWQPRTAFSLTASTPPPPVPN